MQTAPSALPDLYARIDAMQMSTVDCERAKARLRAAERFADDVYDATMAIRTCAASVARHARTVFTASPQH